MFSLSGATKFKYIPNYKDLPYHHRDLQAGRYYGQGLSDLCSLRAEPWK